MTARDVSRSEVKKEMEEGGLPGLEECQAGAGVGVDNPRGRGSDSRAAAAAVPGTEASGRDNVGITSVAQCGGAHGGWRADQAPKYSGKGSLEAFFMQFELAAELNGWPMDSGKKAARLVLSLTDDALACLTALGPVEQRDYGAVVGALQRRLVDVTTRASWSQSYVTGTDGPVSPFVHWQLTLRHSARRAYGHMPPQC
ncbi:hypothetical protein AAFF_G00014480 [Aldrovandia affinis]|uniref:Uncharacterized protein n=1 Tax=Aldrovandia affinis TaxID=143900 RepID=A0AAD7R2P4_9TELE|nr:hypothetical protein AAFF_G00014480 [Aldrovandia affinis]